PILIASTTTLQAIGTKAGSTDSAANSGVHTISNTSSPPTFSLPSGTYTGTIHVNLSTSTIDATICFTTDNTSPTAHGAGPCRHGTPYTASVSVPFTQTIKGCARRSGFTDSSVSAAAYAIVAPQVVAPSVVIILD